MSLRILTECLLFTLRNKSLVIPITNSHNRPPIYSSFLHNLAYVYLHHVEREHGERKEQRKMNNIYLSAFLVSDL